MRKITLFLVLGLLFVHPRGIPGQQAQVRPESGPAVQNNSTAEFRGASRWPAPLLLMAQAGPNQAGSSPARREGANSSSSGSASGVTVLRRLGLTGVILLAAFALLGALLWAKHKVSALIDRNREKAPTLRFRGLVLVGARTVYRYLTAAVWLIYAGATLLVLVSALLLVFGQFPHTQQYARQVGLWLWNPTVQIGRGILGYLPRLFYILVIVIVTRFVLRILSFVFRAAERGVISLEPWVHRDVVRPTALIAKFLIIVVALFFIAPLIPGTGSTAAKGISIILGLMISFGSSSTVGNFVAGIVLMYMRPFQNGDRVKIGETVGDVAERTFLYTKVVTIKNEEVIVPSLTALSAPMINYSARAGAPGLILHTSVTIGYDAPWRRVHELLLQAAERTENVARDPKPFVFQTALDDFYVSYQLNVFTNAPAMMAEIHSRLHQNIQDAFNEGGVEICSPHYHQLRDGNTTTAPAAYRSKDYAAGKFHVEVARGTVGS